MLDARPKDNKPAPACEGGSADRLGGNDSEQTLSASEERYRAISELLFGYVYSYRVEKNFKMNLEWLSGDFEGVTGFSVHEAEARCGWTMAINPEDRDIIRAKVRELLSGKENVSEYRIFTKRGETRWVRDFSRPIRDEAEGRVVRIYGAIQDITERKEAADALKASESRFRLLAENAADMICRIRIDGVFEYVSPASTRITGYSPEELYCKPMIFREIVHPDWRERFDKEWASLLEGDVAPLHEYKIIHKTGAERWLYQRNSLVRDWEGGAVAVEGIISDITERKEAEQEIQESEERFRRLAQATVEGIVIHADGAVIDANENYAAMLGYKLSEVIGKPLDTFIAPESREIVSGRIREGFEEAYESKALRKDGAGIDIEVIGKSIPWHGRTVRVTAVHDITERKRAEEKLQISETKYRILFESASDAIFLMNRHVFVEANLKAEEIFGRLREELIGRSPIELSPERQPDGRSSEDKAGEMIDRAMEGEPMRFEWTHLRAGEIPFHTEVSLHRVDLEEGPLLQAIVRDINQRKELEARIARLRREYEAFMRHELKTLFIPIQMYISMFMEAEEGFTKKQRAWLRRISECVDRVAGVIDSLRKLQDIETGNYSLKLKRRSLRRLVRGVIRDLRGVAEHSGVELRYSGGKDPADMRMDPNLLPGVFSNLILNAIEHIANLKDPSEKIVRVNLRREEHRLKVEIRNGGEPILPERLLTFFEKFNTDRTRKKGGLGLGTTYAYLVTKAHGGDISVTSDAEHGTAVTVTFAAVTCADSPGSE